MTEENHLICVFCNAPWTGNMIEALSYSEGCDNCGYGAEARVLISITCESCKRVIYRKEVVSHPNG